MSVYRDVHCIHFCAKKREKLEMPRKIEKKRKKTYNEEKEKKGRIAEKCISKQKT